MSQIIQSVIHATQLLKLFTVEKPFFTVTELANESGLTKGAVSKIMATLSSQGFVMKDAKKGYALGYTLVNLAGVALTKNKIRETISPLLNQITFDLKEDSHLAVLDEFDIIYLQKIHSNKQSDAKTILGGRNPAHCTSSGKILLANKSTSYFNNYVENGLKAYTEKTIVNPIQLKNEMKFIRQNGYAESYDELTVGVSSIGVPIKDYTNEVVAAISIVGGSKRLTHKTFLNHIAYLKEIGEEASELLGYHRR